MQLLSPRREGLVAFAIFVLALLYCLWYGRVGISSLDSSIVFDGAWRLTQGEALFQDFVTPNGFVPMAMQYLVFQVLGVSWFTFGLHAALLNGCFALLCWHWLRRKGASVLTSTVFGLLSGMVFYPPFGTPYLDQHGFFFTLLLLFLVDRAPAWSRRKRIFAYLSLPLVFLLAFLSKQIPVVFALPVIPLIHWQACRKGQRSRDLIWVAAGLVPALVFLCLLFPPWAIDWADFIYFQWVLPFETGGSRISSQSLFSVRRLLTSLVFVPRVSLGFVFPLFFGLLYGLPLALLGRRVYRLGWASLKTAGTGTLLVAWSLLFVCGWFVRITLNQEANGIALFFLATGLALTWIVRHGLEGDSNPDKWLRRGAVLSFLAVSVVASGYFHHHWVASRGVHDFREAERPQPRFPEGMSGLQFMQYHVTGPSNSLQPDLLLEFLSSDKENFFLFADQSFLYGLSGRRSPLPALWLHPGLTYPQPGHPRFEAFENRLLDRLKRSNPRYLIGLDKRLSMNQAKATDFPRVLKWLESRMERSYEVGGYQIWELTQDS